MTKYSKEDVDRARDLLLKILKPGDTVFCIMRNVSRSGMSREIDLQGPDHEWLSGAAAKVLGCKLGKHEGIKIGGCGMDMGFALVYELSSKLFPTYRCTGTKYSNPRRCASADHFNPGDCRKKRKHTDGYALKHRWL